MAGIPESPNFLFDFSHIPRIDSVGIGALAGLHVSIAQRGGQAGVVDLSHSISSIFVKVKPITMFQHFNTENEAIVNLRGGEGE